MPAGVVEKINKRNHFVLALRAQAFLFGATERFGDQFFGRAEAFIRRPFVRRDAARGDRRGADDGVFNEARVKRDLFFHAFFKRAARAARDRVIDDEFFRRIVDFDKDQKLRLDRAARVRRVSGVGFDRRALRVGKNFGKKHRFERVRPNQSYVLISIDHTP